MRGNDAACLRRAVRAYLTYLDAQDSLASSLCELDFPVLVAFGQRDDVGLRGDEYAMLARCPTVSVVEIRDAGHMTLNEQPGQVAELVLEALSKAP
jgi:pimeloyl-ACP methyl ester carboxylesterase